MDFLINGLKKLTFTGNSKYKRTDDYINISIL